MSLSEGSGPPSEKASQVRAMLQWDSGAAVALGDHECKVWGSMLTLETKCQSE